MPQVVLDGTRIHYLDHAQGDANVAIVFVHTFPLDARVWDQQIQWFGGPTRVIAPDLPGFGGPRCQPSRWRARLPPTPTTSGLLATLDLERAVLVGLRLGGKVAFALFERHREQVAALALASTNPDATTPQDAARYGEQQHWVNREGDLEPLINQLVDRMVGPDTSRRSEAIKWARQLTATTSPAGWITGLEAIKQQPDFGPDLDKIDVPAVVIHGHADQLIPSGVAEAVATRIPDGELVVIPDAGHLVSMEQPEAFNRAVERLTARV